MDINEHLFPRSDLCHQIKDSDRSYYCYIPQQYHWIADRYEIPYYEIETRFLADLYSYILKIDYDRNNPCSFIKQYRPTPAYLNSLVSYFKEHPLLETLILFYQFHGDNVLNSYLRSDLSSAITYIVENKEHIKNNIVDPFPT